VSIVILLLLTVELLVKHSKAKYYYCNVHSLWLKPPRMVDGFQLIFNSLQSKKIIVSVINIQHLK